VAGLRSLFLVQVEDCVHSPMKYRAGQLAEAIFLTVGAADERAAEVKFRIKRLLAADRALGLRPKSREKAELHYAFFDGPPPGTGADVLFDEYGAFALFAGIRLLEHGLPQLAVVKLLRRIRRPFQEAHTKNLAKDAQALFDQKKIDANSRPGQLAFDSTSPVILIFMSLTGSSVDKAAHPVGRIYDNERDMMAFILKQGPGKGFAIFEFSRAIHDLSRNLFQTVPVKRGRAARAGPS
jgi:hypothetical protein